MAISAPHGRVLIVDVEGGVRSGVASVLESQGIVTVAVGSGEEALRAARESHYDVILVDPSLPGLAGSELLGALREADAQTLVVVTSGFASVQGAVEAMRVGVFDYLPKPVRSEELILVVKHAFERIGQNVEPSEPDETGFAGIVGQSPAMRAVFQTVRRVASSKATVLIEGESGTGKELVARAIHNQSKRCAFPFVSVHCSALPGSLLESELFGHEKGAFTGAIRMQKGKFELADRGTLLLDEVATLEMRAQIDLLRVLQEHEFMRIGGAELIRTDARVIATSNEPLQEIVQSGRFREDLYYRLNVVRIELPPLRERIEDLELLTQYFVRKYARENERAVIGVEENAFERLRSWPWSGNVRELENVIERAIVLGTRTKIRVEDLPEEMHATDGAAATGSAVPGAERLRLTPRLEAVERDLIVRALQASRGNRVRAAESLGISERALRYKIQKYGIPAPRTGDGQSDRGECQL